MPVSYRAFSVYLQHNEKYTTIQTSMRLEGVQNLNEFVFVNGSFSQNSHNYVNSYIYVISISIKLVLQKTFLLAKFMAIFAEKFYKQPAFPVDLLFRLWIP